MSENLEQQVQRLLAENKLLRAKSSLLNSILDNAPILISAKDLQGKILFVNQHFRVLEGPSPEEFIHKNVYDLFPPDIADTLWQNDLEAQCSEKPIQADEMVNHKTGRSHTYHTTKFRLLDDEENLMGTCAVSFDITERKRLEQEVLRDFLTGLYNLRYLEEHFERDLARANKLGVELVLVFIDLDEFKQVNDQLGHDRGNEVLRALAKVLKDNMFRIDDVAIRLGGDEFGLLMQSESRAVSSGIIEYVHSEINAAIAEVMQGESIQCTASMGVKFLNPSQNELTYHDVYHEVDKALYQAKCQGKNRILYLGDEKSH